MAWLGLDPGFLTDWYSLAADVACSRFCLASEGLFKCPNLRVSSPSCSPSMSRTSQCASFQGPRSLCPSKRPTPSSSSRYPHSAAAAHRVRACPLAAALRLSALPDHLSVAAPRRACTLHYAVAGGARACTSPCHEPWPGLERIGFCVSADTQSRQRIRRQW